MTATMKLAAVFAGAFLLLAQGTDAAQAGHRHADRKAEQARIAQYWEYQRAMQNQRQRGEFAHRNGSSYGKRARLYYQQHGDFSRKRAYGQRGRQHSFNGDGAYWSDRLRERKARRHFHDHQTHRHDFFRHDGRQDQTRRHRRHDGQQARNFFDRDFDRTRRDGDFRRFRGDRRFDRRFESERDGRIRRHRQFGGN